MPLRLICCVAYLCETLCDWRQADYDTLKLTKALKGKEINGYVNAKIGDRWLRITTPNKDRAIEWFAERLAPIIDRIGAPKSVLVPVPNSQVVKSAAPDFRTAIIANAISQKCNSNVAVSPILRWRTPQTPAHEGGERDEETFYGNLRTIGALPPGKVILFDDVYTTGAHLRACTRRIAELGIIVEAAVCGSHATYQQLPDPYTVPEETI